MTFFNIFDKRKVEEKEKSKITVDWREKNSLVISELVKLNHFVNFEQLEIADYIIKDIAIERKTVNDLKNSIINRRVINQLINLKKYPRSLLIIEGFNTSFYLGNMHENSLRGFLLSIIFNFDIPVIFTLNEKDTARYINLIATKKEENKEHSIRHSKKMSKEERKQFILEGFPKIGPVKAKSLINNFKTLKNIFNANQTDIEKVLGTSSSDFLDILS